MCEELITFKVMMKVHIESLKLDTVLLSDW